jgi:hypothetical protein
MSIEAMKQAYEVPLVEQLESVPADERLVIDDADGMGTRFIPVGRMCHDAAKALRTAIEEAEKQEPVAYAVKTVGGKKWHSIHASKGASDKWLEYRVKEQAQGEQYEQHALYTTPPAAPVQEGQHAIEQALTRLQKRYSELEAKVAAQRKWQGLTDDEIMDMYNEPRSDAEMIAFGREVEAKLKEKNT